MTAGSAGSVLTCAAGLSSLALKTQRLPANLHPTPALLRGFSGFTLPSAAAVGDAAPTQLLLRDFIGSSLYHPEQGYFNAKQPPVGLIQRPFSFRELAGKSEYQLALKRTYAQLKVAWLTPAEIFKPWYGYAVANFILQYHRHKLNAPNELHIIEIGGGTGTLALTVLDYIRANAPEVYKYTSYVCIEISSTLAARQRQAVLHRGGHRQRFWAVNSDASVESTWAGRDDTPCFILAMEVLDNLPHDRVWRATPCDSWQQTEVLITPQARPRPPRGDAHSAAGLTHAPRGANRSAAGPTHRAAGLTQGGTADANGGGGMAFEERLAPLTDPLIQRCLAASGAVRSPSSSWLQRTLDYITDAGGAPAGEGEALFLPTACLALLDSLAACRPRHVLLAADFSELPGVKVPGVRAPLVSGRVDGQVRDYDSIYVPWGAADIFFPTDFELAVQLHNSAMAASLAAAGLTWHAEHFSSRSFLHCYADYRQTTTLSGFNPMLEDYANTRVLVANSATAPLQPPPDTPPAAHSAQEDS